MLKTTKKQEIIYGVYDSVNQPLFRRLNDFFIDRSSVALREKAYFFQLLAVMVDAGIPLVHALKLLAARSENERFRRVINTIVFTITQGKTFSQSMARFSDVFDEVEIGIVRAGEAAGNLDKMLNRIADQLGRSNELRTKLVSAAIYPVVVLTMLLLVTSAMLVWVIPTLVNLLAEGGLQKKDFPVATLILVNASNIISNYWWALIFGLLILVLGVRLFVQSESGRFWWDSFKLKMPLFGKLLRKIIMLRFISVLGVLIESGLPVIRTLQIVAPALKNELYRIKIYEVIAKVQHGAKLSGSLASSQEMFEETIVGMLAVGEQSASIGFMSNKIAAQYELEIDHALKRFLSILEPLLVVFVGLAVALLALALLTPIFKLTQLV